VFEHRMLIQATLGHIFTTLADTIATPSNMRVIDPHLYCTCSCSPDIQSFLKVERLSAHPRLKWYASFRRSR
jgi:hypothetical protein